MGYLCGEDLGQILGSNVSLRHSIIAAIAQELAYYTVGEWGERGAMMGVLQLFSELFNSVWRSGEDETNSYCGITAMLLLVVLVATWIGA